MCVLLGHQRERERERERMNVYVKCDKDSVPV